MGYPNPPLRDPRRHRFHHHQPPDKLNALNDQVVGELADAAERVASEAAINEVILSGAGQKAFVGGGGHRRPRKAGTVRRESAGAARQAMLRRFETCGNRSSRP